MSEHPNVAPARRLFETYNTGRADLSAEMFADDAVLHLAGHNRISGTFRGRAEITAGLTKMFQLLATGTAKADPPESVLANDEHTMIFFARRVSATATRWTRPMSWRQPSIRMGKSRSYGSWPLTRRSTIVSGLDRLRGARRCSCGGLPAPLR